MANFTIPNRLGIVFCQSDCITLLVELLQMYRDKMDVFASTASLVCFYCNDPIRRKSLLAQSVCSFHPHYHASFGVYSNFPMY